MAIPENTTTQNQIGCHKQQSSQNPPFLQQKSRQEQQHAAQKLRKLPAVIMAVVMMGFLWQNADFGLNGSTNPSDLRQQAVRIFRGQTQLLCGKGNGRVLNPRQASDLLFHPCCAVGTAKVFQQIDRLLSTGSMVFMMVMVAAGAGFFPAVMIMFMGMAAATVFPMLMVMVMVMTTGAAFLTVMFVMVMAAGTAFGMVVMF